MAIYLLIIPLLDDPSDEAMPNTTDPRNIIAFAWDDWNPNRMVGTIRYETLGSAPNRIFVVEYNAVPHFIRRWR